MDILLVHQNFPGQFRHLAPALASRGHRVLALASEQNRQRSAIRTLRYPMPDPKPDRQECRLGTTYVEMTDRAHRVARACRTLRDTHGVRPDVVFGHSGWGETLFLREIWPQARHLTYAEFYYNTHGCDVGFDPEFSPRRFETDLTVIARQAHLALAMAQSDAALAPTAWQADSFPACFRDRIHIIHDGIDTARACPRPDAEFAIPGGPVLRAGDEVLTYVARNLEPYRGYHIFMRALPQVMAARPHAHVVIVGADGVSYGARPPSGQSWKQVFLDEVADRLDMRRVHFVGPLPYEAYLRVLQVSRVHAYLTVPFVLSWSLLEAMSAAALVVASRTPPVEEVIQDGKTGRLVDFFDIEGWAEALGLALACPAEAQGVRAAARAHVLDNYDLHGICLPRLVAFVERG